VNRDLPCWFVGEISYQVLSVRSDFFRGRIDTFHIVNYFDYVVMRLWEREVRNKTVFNYDIWICGIFYTKYLHVSLLRLRRLNVGFPGLKLNKLMIFHWQIEFIVLNFGLFSCVISITVHNAIIFVFVKRWHQDSSSFHFFVSEMMITKTSVVFTL